MFWLYSIKMLFLYESQAKWSNEIEEINVLDIKKS